MQIFLITIFTLLSAISFLLFLYKYKFFPLWLMLSVWFVAIAISQLDLSSLEWVWPVKYWALIGVSLVSFALGSWLGERRRPVKRENTKIKNLRWVIYILFLVSCLCLYLFYKKAGNFPLLAPDPDEFLFDVCGNLQLEKTLGLSGALFARHRRHYPIRVPHPNIFHRSLGHGLVFVDAPPQS